MTPRILTGSKEEIVAKVAELKGEVREVIVFVDDPAVIPQSDDIFAEMAPHCVQQAQVDDSRESIYREVD